MLHRCVVLLLLSRPCLSTIEQILLLRLGPRQEVVCERGLVSRLLLLSYQVVFEHERGQAKQFQILCPFLMLLQTMLRHPLTMIGQYLRCHL